jgi:CDP-4-dehydro-6-deoxyglucose reductase
MTTSISKDENMGFTITLQPDNLSFVAKAGETILDAAKRHGIQLPRGCGDGACGLCKGNLLQGSIDHGKSTEIGLSARDRDAGMVLFCCARPTSDLVVERRELGIGLDMSDWD